MPAKPLVDRALTDGDPEFDLAKQSIQSSLSNVAKKRGLDAEDVLMLLDELRQDQVKAISKERKKLAQRIKPA